LFTAAAAAAVGYNENKQITQNNIITISPTPVLLEMTNDDDKLSPLINQKIMN